MLLKLFEYNILNKDEDITKNAIRYESEPIVLEMLFREAVEKGRKEEAQRALSLLTNPHFIWSKVKGLDITPDIIESELRSNGYNVYHSRVM